METEATFNKHLREVQDDVLVMGGIVTKAIDRALEALKKRDLTLAHRVIAEDPKINEQRFNIEDKCINLLATKQPAAIDLRVIVTVLNIS